MVDAGTARSGPLSSSTLPDEAGYEASIISLLAHDIVNANSTKGKKTLIELNGKTTKCRDFIKNAPHFV